MELRTKTFCLPIKILAAFLVTTIILFAHPVPGFAKGPESLVISGPGLEYPINFMDDIDVDLVTKLLKGTGLWFDTGIALSPKEIAGKLGSKYTFTWVNSGPPSLSREERTIIQYIYLDAEAGPIIHTPSQDSLDNWGSGIIGWFAAPDGLEEALTELGVPISPSASVLDANDYKTAADTVLAKPSQAGFPWYFTVVGIALLGMVALYAVRMLRGRNFTSWTS